MSALLRCSWPGAAALLMVPEPWTSGCEVWRGDVRKCEVSPLLGQSSQVSVQSMHLQQLM